MEETEHCPVQQPLRQGDILKISPNGSSPQPFSLAVIINADCDMAWEKHDGVIALLPIYRFTEYLQIFWLPGFINNQIEALSKTIRELCKINEDNISEIINWIESLEEHTSFDVDKFISRFELNKKNGQIVKNAIQRLMSAIASRQSMSLACVKNFAPDPEDCDKYLSTQILDAKKTLGDGHFFVTDLKGDNSVGFVIRMRRIHSIDARRCFSAYSALQSTERGTEASAYRLSRFTPHYKFKIAQIFAQQYSRIGLPDELTALSSLAIDNAVEHIKSS
ncbi:hypothetical protein K6Y74_27760 [Burkholderia cenocepacia]|uniref:hypothetical protein n=1 Tax=Burkholderia cenocepacia TaxID=95486 RepID=UPI000A7D2108|nr:hypothetical protein [Burkholderia cenocepacia]MCW3587165.1 hypothetical protein [Burkholderia cenocepacia]MCW3632111.1 hypothetical protein [Burkholderia cenocepacia]MCW3647063.1 hypothetical protein [Burkholderia cenocepacia]MCW5179205.1 hypothetical protein [Burkholderia cenocepacia]